MGEKLTDLTTPEDRERALGSTNRLEDFKYPPDNQEEDKEGEGFNLETVDCKDLAQDYWSKIAWAALVRFPKLYKGEKVSVKDLRERLKRIKKAGYNIKSYNRMNQKELWNYNLQIRAAVYREVEKACPDVLNKINAVNRKEN